jgi:hypothetical protein
MDGKKLTDLIDEFLLDQMNEADRARLEALRNSDPRIDRHVKNNAAVFNVIQYMCYYELRQKLQLLDRTIFEKSEIDFHDVPCLPFLKMAV